MEAVQATFSFASLTYRWATGEHAQCNVSVRIRLAATVLAGLDFDGDLTNGGLAAFAIGGYSRMLGDAKRTPLTSIRGDADQWTIGAGLAFTF